MEVVRHNRDEFYCGSDDEEYNPFHDKHTVASSDEDALHQ
jgi:hypothetical protein